MRRLLFFALSCIALGAVSADLASNAGWRLTTPGARAAAAIEAGEDLARLDDLNFDEEDHK